MACLFGHKWNGCKCTKCGKTRNEGHDWNGCTCRICGMKRTENHDWQRPNPKKCFERCSICGKERRMEHDFQPVEGKCELVCSRCGETRENHEWENGLCKICGAQQPVQKAGNTPQAPKAVPNKGGMPTCWVFACYDRERVQGLALFKADFYSEANVTAMVRSHLKVPDFVEVKYVAPPAWEAPGITATTDSFDCNMDDIDTKVNAYLVKTGYSADKPRNAMKTTMPYPNAGLLLIIVNMLP